ncbi:MAG: PAS domain S-box protein, partial [Pseudomonadales bacterium]|nr:PAS domain S-box protein [Pseudomonadales bacterium]
MAVTSRLIVDKVLDLLIDTVFVVDAEGCIAFISTSCETLLGYTQEELLGRRIIEFVLPEDRELTLKAASAVMEGRSHLHFKNQYVRKDGQIVDIMWSARWSESEGLRFAVARDITALKHAERKQSAVYEISEAAHATENLESLYQQIHRIITGLLPTDLFFTAQYDGLNDTLSFPYFSGGLAKQPEPQSLESGSRLARVIHSGKSLLLSSADLDTGSTLELAGIEGYQQWLGVPLISQKGVIGALVMARRSGDIVFTERDRDLLCFVSTQVATTIER